MFKITHSKFDLTGFKFIIMINGQLEMCDTVLDWKPKDRGCVVFFDNIAIEIEPCSNHAEYLFNGEYFDRELKNYVKNKRKVIEFNCNEYDESHEYNYETYITHWNSYKDCGYRVALDVWKLKDYIKSIKRNSNE